MRWPCVVERGACVDHSSSALATRCAFVEVVIMCALGTVCMRTVCALYALSALATRYAFGVKSWAHNNALAKIANFPCAGRAFPMRPPCVTGPLPRVLFRTPKSPPSLTRCNHKPTVYLHHHAIRYVYAASKG